MAVSTATGPLLTDDGNGGGGAPPPCMEVVALVTAAVRRGLAQKARDDRVTLADIDGVLAELSAPGGALARALASQTVKCSQVLAARHHHPGRKGAFHRLMVRPFETLLDGDPPVFPRACLPHYFKVIDAAGGAWLGKSEDVCRAVLQSLLVEHGHGLEWDVFYADPRVRRVLAYALRHLVATLETPSGRWLWEQTMLRPDRNGRAPARDQADQIYRSLRDTWRALDLETRTPDATGGR